MEATPVEESTAAAGGLGGGEQLEPMADESAAMPRATVEIAGSLGAKAGVTDAMPEARAEKLAVLEE